MSLICSSFCSLFKIIICNYHYECKSTTFHWDNKTISRIFLFKIPSIGILNKKNIHPDSFKRWRKTSILQGITIRKSSIIYSLQHWREVRSVGWSERWFIKWVVKFWGWSRLEKTIWSQIAPWPEIIPPKGVSFSDLICIFAMSYQSFACFLFATLR